MKRLKIAICGASKGELDQVILEKAYDLGKIIAQKGHILLTGACTGYPQKAAEGCRTENGLSIGVSPSNTWEDNEKLYPGLQENLFDTVIYTGLGEARNFILVRSADICIFMGKGSGTLMEFTIALKHGKKIGILAGSGGVETIVDQVLALSWDKFPPIINESEPENLINYLLS